MMSRVVFLAGRTLCDSRLQREAKPSFLSDIDVPGAAASHVAVYSGIMISTNATSHDRAAVAIIDGLVQYKRKTEPWFFSSRTARSSH
jgi:hypothetical protein